MDFVNISWKIPVFVEQESYYVRYGYQNTYFDYTSDSISSESNVSITNQTYSMMIEGLVDGTVYYAQVVAAFGESNQYKRFSDTFAFRTKETGKSTIL